MGTIFVIICGRPPHPQGERGATLKRAITTGIDPTGSHLAAPMPQWRLADKEWADLLAYLKTLH